MNERIKAMGTTPVITSKKNHEQLLREMRTPHSRPERVKFPKHLFDSKEEE